MAWLHVFIGRLDDPKFSWDGGDWNANIPERIGPFFPIQIVDGRVENAYWTLRERIKAGTYEGKQTDWSGFVAKVTKKQIQALVADTYPDPTTLRGDAVTDHQELQKVVGQLEDDKLYALVGAEFPTEADLEN